MQSAEARVLHRATKGGAAAVMQAAAHSNERAGLVDRTRATLAANEGMTATETVLPGQMLRTECAAGQPVHSELESPSTEYPIASSDAITIGQKTSCCEDDVQSASILQQPSVLGMQQPMMEKCIKRFNDGKDKWDIDALITGINDLLNSQHKQPEKPGTSAAISSSTPKALMLLSFIQNGVTFLKFVNDHIGKTALKDNIWGTGGGNILSEILKQQPGNIDWLAGGLYIVDYMLSKFEQMSTNKTDCLKILVDLVNHMKRLNIRMSEEEKKLRDALLLVVEGCIMCASQIQSGMFFRFLKITFDSVMLNNLCSEVNLFLDMTLTGVIRIQQQLSVNLLLAQPTYPAWGVEMEEPVNQIIEMLELEKPKQRAEAMVINGFRGIGKTTLANAVFANLKLKGFNYTKIKIYKDPYINDFKSMHQQLLKNVFPEYQHRRQITLRYCEEGRYPLTQAFQSEPS